MIRPANIAHQGIAAKLSKYSHVIYVLCSQHFLSSGYRFFSPYFGGPSMLANTQWPTFQLVSEGIHVLSAFFFFM